MKRLLGLGGALLVGATMLGACSTDDAAPADTATTIEDVAVEAGALDTAAPVDAAPDVPVVPDVPDVGDVPELPDTAAPDAGPEDVSVPDVDAGPPRIYANRAIGGVSMGAAAVIMALQNPDKFDFVGGLGGYADLRYLVTTGQRLQLGGFCPLETLTSYPDGLNDPAHDPPLFCGPGRAMEDLEHVQDFNHLHFDSNGATFDRDFYIQVFQSLTMAFGNFTSPPSDISPFLPTGVGYDWFSSTAFNKRCVDPPPIPQELSYNAEYNPEGLFPVIPFCDSDHKSEPAPKDGVFDPTVNHTTPVDILLAVDINGNGKRDYGEPLFLNMWERFDDVGADGCPSPREDGDGGCLAAEAPDATEADPNGDDFHWWERPFGTENDSLRSEGEPYRDDGLDGVPGTEDIGEGNGAFDRSAAMDRASGWSATELLAGVDDDALDTLDFWLDGGIRDPLHAAVSARHIIGALRGRGTDARVYYGISDRPGSLLPDIDESYVLPKASEIDMSAANLGRHVYVEYGDPNASPEKLAQGDGGHVGTNIQVINRVVLWLVWAAKRFPDPDLKIIEDPNPKYSERIDWYSEGMKARRVFTIALPPGYYEPENAEKRYPVIFLLHGLGQNAESFGPIGIVTSGLMQDGVLPKSIIVFPDGDCCDRHMPTGRRECACRRDGDVKRCVDPDCKGESGTCEIRYIPTNELQEECHSGSLYFDLLTNRWGEPRDDLGYGQSVLEVLEYVDRHWRTRSGTAE